ncbi:MAG: AAA family ATPase [Chloroflexi bacterium]|nr:AAA family ATPase [Chloroflexota bacterium]
MPGAGALSRPCWIAGRRKAKKMRPLKDLLNNRMDDGTLPGNMPTSSNTEPFAAESDLCSLCGRQSICGGLGYVRYDLPVEHPQFGQLFRCPNSPADSQRVKRLRTLGNLDAFADKTFDTFHDDLKMLTPTQDQSLKDALKTARKFAEHPEGWLLLEGTYGCGKTHLAAAVGNERLRYEESVLFITTPDLLDHLRSTYGADSESGYDEMFDRLRNAPLMILDDLGVENPSAWAQEKLFQLLNHRYSHMLPTVITTNADLDMLDPRIRSRLMDSNIIHRIRISAPDYRTPVQDQRDELSSLPLYSGMTFATLDLHTGLTPDDRQNLERAAAAARSYAENPSGWLIFLGTYGSGKTHLAAAIANVQQERGKQVVFVTAPDLLDYLRVTFSPSSGSSFDRRFQMVRSTPLLVLDDLSTESATAWAKEKLFQLLNHRYVASLPTVITSSSTVEKIDERIRTRLMDRRICTTFGLTAPSYSSRISRK